MARQMNEQNGWSTEITPVVTLRPQRKKILMNSVQDEYEFDEENEYTSQKSRSILHRAYSTICSFVQHFRSPSSKGNRVNASGRRSLNNLSAATEKLDTNPRKKRRRFAANGQIPIRLGNNLGIERQSYADGNGDELDLDMDSVRVRPPTAFNDEDEDDEKKELGAHAAAESQSPESVRSEIQNMAMARPPIPPSTSALGKRRQQQQQKRITFSSSTTTNPHKSQSQFQGAGGTLANPPLDHSTTSHGTTTDKIQRRNDIETKQIMGSGSRLPAAATENVTSVVVVPSKNRTGNMDSTDHARAMYIPWNDAPLSKSGPSFPIIEKKSNEKTIKGKHWKSALYLERAAETRAEKNRCRKECWQKRSLIGLYKKTLREEYNLQSLTTTTANNSEERFHHINWFSSGTSSGNHVGRYFDLTESRLVAIKNYGCGLARNEAERLQSKISAMIEISALLEVDSANVVQMLGYYELNSRIHMVMEACDRSLKCEMQKARMCPIMTRDIIRQVLQGLEFCHKKGCLHANICPENILVNGGAVVKLADFKMALFLNRPIKPECPIPETINYSAPEILVRSPDFTLAADIWSVGCLLSEMIKGVSLWNYSNVMEQLYHIQETFGAMVHRKPYVVTYPCTARKGKESLRGMFTRIQDDAFSFVTKCLDLDPAKRSNCSELLEDDFLLPEREIELNSGQSSITVADSCGDQTPKQRSFTAPLAVDKFIGIDTPVHQQQQQLLQQCSIDLPNAQSSPEILQSQYHYLNPESKYQKSKSKLRLPTFTTRSAEEDGTGLGTTTKIPKPAQRLQVQVLSFPRGSTTTTTTATGTTTEFNCHVPVPYPSEEKYNRQEPTVTTQTQMESPSPREEEEKPFPSKENFMDGTSCSELEPMTPTGTSQRQGIKKTSRVMMKEILQSLGSSNWNNPELYITKLKRISKVSPKLFSNEVGNLLTILLDLIAISKPTLAGLAIRILKGLYSIVPSLLELEAERIIPVLLGKLGSIGFIDGECSEILQQIVNQSDPLTTVLIFAQATQSQTSVGSRIAAGKHLCEAVRKLNFLEDIGNKTPLQRQLTNNLFDVAARFIWDVANINSRELGKDLFYLLLQHPSFWRLYIDHFPMQQRARLNPYLDGIRKVLTQERKREKESGSNNN